MLPDAIWSAIIGAVSALIANAVVKPISDRITRKSEERRWYLDYFLPREIEALHTLHAALVKTYYGLKSWKAKAVGISRLDPQKSLDQKSAEYLKKLNDDFKETMGYGSGPFLEALSLSWIYLDEKTKEIMNDVALEVKTLQFQISNRLRRDSNHGSISSDIDWKKFEALYNDAQKQMERLLNQSEKVNTLLPRGKDQPNNSFNPTPR